MVIVKPSPCPNPRSLPANYNEASHQGDWELYIITERPKLGPRFIPNQ